jgi:hypothetical protein
MQTKKTSRRKTAAKPKKKAIKAQAKKATKKVAQPKAEEMEKHIHNPNVSEYSLMTIYDLLDLGNLELKPQEEWKVISSQHGIEETFTTGLLGRHGFLLLKSISDIYRKTFEANPPNIEEDNKGRVKSYQDFLGDHIFLEVIAVDKEKKVVELHFGS